MITSPICMIYAVLTAPLNIFLVGILWYGLCILLIIVVSILWSVYHAYHDRMQVGVETRYAWLRKATELFYELCRYHFHNFNGDVIYLMTLFQMILLQNLSYGAVLQCTSWGMCCLLFIVFMYDTL
jgi:hypothetical protein